MLDALHYRGLVRVVRRENGIRIYRTHRHESSQGVASGVLSGSSVQARMDALVDVVVNIYAPLPTSSLSFYIRRLRYAVPQWRSEITAANKRARERLAHACVDGVDWYWPADENPRRRSGEGALTRTVRSRRARPDPLRATVGLDLPIRSLHAGVKANAIFPTKC
jgi:hypothetical protein